MVRKVFFSFHFDNDFWRTQTVRNMGSLDGQTLASANNWEELKRTSDQAVRGWITTHMKGKSCLVVLNGSSTAGRKWIKYEIKKAWEDGRGVVGVHVNKLKHSDETQSRRGSNPFSDVTANGYSLSGIPKLWIPGGSTSKEAYNSISENIGSWIEEAIRSANNTPVRFEPLWAAVTLDAGFQARETRSAQATKRPSDQAHPNSPKISVYEEMGLRWLFRVQ